MCSTSTTRAAGRRCSRCSAARSPPTGAWPSTRSRSWRRICPGCGPAWTAASGHCPAGDLPGRAASDAYLALFPGAPTTFLPATMATRLARGTTARGADTIHRRRTGPGGSGRGFWCGPHPGRGRLPRRTRMGRGDRARHPLAALEARLAFLRGGGSPGSIATSKSARSRRKRDPLFFRSRAHGRRKKPEEHQ